MEKSIVAQKKPFVKEVDSGIYAWCACGRSKNQPMCDESHKGTGITPKMEKIEEKKTVAWCGCKQSKNPPYCDGSHNSL